MTVVVRRLEGKLLVSMERALSFIERDKCVCNLKIMNDNHVKFCFDYVRKLMSKIVKQLLQKRKRAQKILEEIAGTF